MERRDGGLTIGTIRMWALEDDLAGYKAVAARFPGVDDPRNPAKGVSFGYDDRAEPCYTKHVHRFGPCALRCHVDAARDVYAKCSAEECAAAPAFRLGRMCVESDACLSGAIRVDVPFIGARAASDGSPFADAVRRWMDGTAEVLSIKSPMGTGKSTFLDGLLADVFAAQPGTTVLVVTYRQSLAAEHSRKVCVI